MPGEAEKALRSVVIVRFDEDGEIDYHVCGDETVRVFIVDESAPHDRVYEWLPRCAADEIRAIIPAGCEIGSNQDDRHHAVETTILAHLDGRPRLRVVDATSHQRNPR
jgi:hypothetical protein